MPSIDPADQQRDAARHRPPLRGVVMVIVMRVIVADVIAGGVGVRGEAGGAQPRRGSPRRKFARDRR